MRKRFFKYTALCLSLVSMLAFAGCGDSKKTASTEKSTTTESTTEATTTESTTEATTEAQTDADGFTICSDKVKTLDYVNVRKTPSTDGEIYQQLANGYEVDRIGYNDEWSKISLDGGEYYIFSELLEVVGSAASEGTSEGSSENSSEESTEAQTSNVGEGKIVVIDAGHQETANDETEPIGPAATETKVKATTGNTGVTTGVAEYEINLEIALKLETELTARGYTVKMIRTSNDVDISNATRAEYANNLNADAVIKIHTNGSTDDTATGVMTVCQTSDNPYNSGIYDKCKSLATNVLSGLISATGAESDGIWETDNMAGINWSTVPVTMVEVGYMTTASDEALLVTDDYQSKIAKGIADGVDAYIAESNGTATDTSDTTAGTGDTSADTSETTQTE